MKNKISELLNKAEECPNNGCCNQGYVVVQTSERRYVTKDMASDACDASLEGQLYSDDEFEQEQCEFCYRNENSKFNIIQSILSLIEKEDIESRINENRYYLGYDETVHECVRRDAERRIVQLEARGENER